MKFIKIKTKKFTPPKADIIAELSKRLPKLKEGDVLFIVSKILGIHQDRMIKIEKPETKNQLIKSEADFTQNK